MTPLRSFMACLMILLLAAACNLGGASPTALAAVSTTEESSTSEAPTAPPQSIDPTVTTAVQQVAAPGNLPEERGSHAGDHDSSSTSEQRRAPGGDRFTFGQFERPFNAESMDVYFPYLDIQEAFVGQDDQWVYAIITVKGTDSDGGLPGAYAVELDLDLDGRGDFFILASNPASTEWSTDRVRVWTDTNEDVGGTSVINADNSGVHGDGYETLVFDQGQGDDPDTAWARLSPDNPTTVHIAIKQSLLAGDNAFLAGVWAGSSALDAALFDLNDSLNHEQAGAALVELDYFYPIKGLSELDNTCRISVGFEPRGSEPGICGLEEGCQPPAGGCTQQGYDWNASLCCCSWQGTFPCNYSP